MDNLKSQRSAIPAERARAGGKRDDYVPFLMRFRAWWEGVDAEELMRRRKNRPARSKRIDVDLSAVTQQRRWPPKRLDIVNRICGPNCVHVGGLDYARRLLSPAPFDESMSVLDMNAGLGAVPRYIAEEYGSWVTGLEEDEELAKAGMRISVQERLGDKAPIKACDPESVEISDRRYQRIIMRERLHTVRNKTRLLTALGNALVPGGTMLLTEFVVADEPSKQAAPVRAWSEACFDTPVLSTEYELKDSIYRLELELKSYRDESEHFRGALRRDWENFVNSLRQEELDQAFVDVMMREATVSKSLISALSGGHLKLLHFVLQRRQTEVLLSDW